MEKVEQLGLLKKLWLKYTNKKQYNHYKQTIEDNTFSVAHQKFNAIVAQHTPQHTPPYTFKHSGNAGDIMYALPTMRELSAGVASPLYLQINQPGIYHIGHPLGNVMLNEKMVEMLEPLLSAQPYISQTSLYQQQPIDYDFDLFRQAPFLLDKGDIARWYVHIFNVFPDFTQAWLQASPDTNYKDYIVLARSQRYNNPHLDYSFLKKYKNIVFVGVEKEYTLMREVLPNLVFKPVKHFLELAEIIAGARLFIGNQSFPFAIAEGLKAKRILEVYYHCPNVIVHGSNGYDVYFQYHFETLVQQLYV